MAALFYLLLFKVIGGEFDPLFVTFSNHFYYSIASKQKLFYEFPSIFCLPKKIALAPYAKNIGDLWGLHLPIRAKDNFITFLEIKCLFANRTYSE